MFKSSPLSFLWSDEDATDLPETMDVNSFLPYTFSESASLDIPVDCVETDAPRDNECRHALIIENPSSSESTSDEEIESIFRQPTDRPNPPPSDEDADVIFIDDHDPPSFSQQRQDSTSINASAVRRYYIISIFIFN